MLEQKSSTKRGYLQMSSLGEVSLFLRSGKTKSELIGSSGGTVEINGTVWGDSLTNHFNQGSGSCMVRD